MNFLDNYAPVVGEFTCIPACFNAYYYSLQNISPFLVGLNPPALKFSFHTFSIQLTRLSHSEPGTGYHAACNSLIQCKATCNANLPDISSIYCVKLNY